MQRLVVKVWEFPVRVIHWVIFVAVLALGFTGAYMHWPFLVVPLGKPSYTMAWMRVIHLACGWAVLIALVGRWVWSLVGNQFASIREFFPFFYAKRRRNFWEVLKYYLFLRIDVPPHLGHNALAALSYLFFWLVLWFQVISGFALYSLYAPGGAAHTLLGWIFPLVGIGWVRLAHYFASWVIAAFIIVHLYGMWVSDLAERDGTGGSMFSGYKYGSIEEFEDSDHRPWKSFDDRRRSRARGSGAFEKSYRPAEGVDLLDGGTLGLDLLVYLEGYGRVLVADCVITGKEPGTLVTLEGEEVPAALTLSLSPHQVGLADLLAVLELQGRMPAHMAVVGVEPECLEVGLELSAPVRQCIPRMVEAMAGVLSSWGVSPEPHPI